MVNYLGVKTRKKYTLEILRFKHLFPHKHEGNSMIFKKYVSGETMGLILKHTDPVLLKEFLKVFTATKDGDFKYITIQTGQLDKLKDRKNGFLKLKRLLRYLRLHNIKLVSYGKMRPTIHKNFLNALAIKWPLFKINCFPYPDDETLLEDIEYTELPSGFTRSESLIFKTNKVKHIKGLETRLRSLQYRKNGYRKIYGLRKSMILIKL
uniref:Uncharacterized protein n=1 Tax=Pithovirus LCDPAC01 TaxID=2506600 RepID=A0A481YNQ6_9VIRU|nr:MAG: hypothetical protein LCDPAC01_00750 [Pithovirus LCDPAC01]